MTSIFHHQDNREILHSNVRIPSHRQLPRPFYYVLYFRSAQIIAIFVGILELELTIFQALIHCTMLLSQQLERTKIAKSKWPDLTHFSTLYYFLVCTGVKMHIFNEKGSICLLVVQNKGYFLCKQHE